MLAKLFLPLLLLTGPRGVVFPEGADLGHVEVLTVEGSPQLPEAVSITLDSIRYRTYRGECLSFTSHLWLFDWVRGSNLSVVEVSIPGSGFSQSFVTVWGVVVMDLTGGFDGAFDFAGTSGETITATKQVRETQQVKPEFLHLFVGNTVDLTVRYYGRTSIAASGAARAEVDERIDPARLTVRYTPAP